MSRNDISRQALLTFADSSPLSIRARALIFADPRSRRLQRQAVQLASTSLALLVVGESGTGKELLARHIHRESQRPGLFVAASCAALSPSFAEAELFGHAPGRHPAGASSRAGWFGSAHGGTLYLDEIGDLPLPLQVKLLAALQSGEILRVGAQQAQPADVRLVAASSIDLAQVVRAGKFHEGLYQYLRDGCLELPPLRERVGDILPLAEYFLGVHAQRLGLPIPSLSEAAQALLEGYFWPGNTRELENVIHFALLTCGSQILPEHLRLPALAPAYRLAASDFAS